MPQEYTLHAYQIADADFVVCDVETTGLHPERNRIKKARFSRFGVIGLLEKYQIVID